MAEPITPQRLDEIRAREQAATPGPWKWEHDGDAIAIVPPKDNDLVVMVYDDDAGIPPDDTDGEFIAHAREDVPALLVELARAQRCIDAALAEHPRGADPQRWVAADCCTYCEVLWPCPTVRALTGNEQDSP